MKKMDVVSLFSGCGGMDLGLMGGFSFLGKYYTKNPVNIIYSGDNDPYACQIFNDNFPHKAITEDVKLLREHEVPPHHMLIGGFPCQSFSIVAQNPPRLGYQNPNGQLFFEMCRILRYRKPLCFIAENVKGILSANKNQAFPLILQIFREAGYQVTYDILDASDYGVPQKRERVFIVGFREKSVLDRFVFPKPVTSKKKTPLKNILFPDEQINEKYYFSERAVTGMEKVKGKMNKGRVQDPDGPCNTVSAHLAKVSLNSVDPVLKVGGRFRRFTPREVARIQSFPEEFQLNVSENRAYRALGNAVPPVLMWHVAKSVIKALKTQKTIFVQKPYRTEKEKRSFNMSQIKCKNTEIELLLRKKLWNKGYRYRVNYAKLPGKPDIVFLGKKVAIFCDSSFWHGRNLNDLKRIKTNKSYWETKIQNNQERDLMVNNQLALLGWHVLRFWDEDIINNLDNVVSKIDWALKQY